MGSCWQRGCSRGIKWDYGEISWDRGIFGGGMGFGTSERVLFWWQVSMDTFILITPLT